MSDLIDRKALIETIKNLDPPGFERSVAGQVAIRIVKNAPTVDAVEAERYEELRESFVDYVCSGVPNPAPYCKNRCEGCVDQRGWCKTHDGACRGFNPDGERRTE